MSITQAAVRRIIEKIPARAANLKAAMGRIMRPVLAELIERKPNGYREALKSAYDQLVLIAPHNPVAKSIAARLQKLKPDLGTPKQPNHVVSKPAPDISPFTTIYYERRAARIQEERNGQKETIDGVLAQTGLTATENGELEDLLYTQCSGMFDTLRTYQKLRGAGVTAKDCLQLLKATHTNVQKDPDEDLKYTYINFAMRTICSDILPKLSNCSGDVIYQILSKIIERAKGKGLLPSINGFAGVLEQLATLQLNQAELLDTVNKMMESIPLRNFNLGLSAYKEAIQAANEASLSKTKVLPALNQVATEIAKQGMTIDNLFLMLMNQLGQSGNPGFTKLPSSKIHRHTVFTSDQAIGALLWTKPTGGRDDEYPLSSQIELDFTGGVHAFGQLGMDSSNNLTITVSLNRESFAAAPTLIAYMARRLLGRYPQLSGFSIETDTFPAERIILMSEMK